MTRSAFLRPVILGLGFICAASAAWCSQALMQPVKYVSGKVALEDGSAPPDRVLIELVCGGIASPEGYADGTGTFAVELGRGAATVADTSMPSAGGGGTFGTPRSSVGAASRAGSGGSPTVVTEGCTLWASLAGFHPALYPLEKKGETRLDVGTTVLRPLREGSSGPATSLEVPEPARAAFEKGLAAAQKKRWSDARKGFEEAVHLFPRYAEAYYELGRALEQAKDFGRAREAYRQAVATDEKYVLPSVQLAGLGVREEKWDEVLEATARVVQLEPSGYPGAYYMKAAAHFNRKEYPDAEASAREAVRLDTDHRFPDANHIYGVLMMMRRDYQGAAEQLRLYLKLASRAADAEIARGRLASCEKALKGLEKQ